MSASKSIDAAKERVKAELHELQERIVKLEAFVSSERVNALGDKMQALLRQQLDVMCQYMHVLEERLKIWDD